jgi:hypothetical protein
MPREAKKYKERGGTPAAQRARAMAAHGEPTPTTVMRGLKRQRIREGGGGGCKTTWLPESGDEKYWVAGWKLLTKPIISY